MTTTNHPYVLVLNCGSSSIKFAIVDASTGDAPVEGLAENLGNDDARIKISDGENKQKIALPAKANHDQALEQIQHCLDQYPELKAQLAGVGHRVVHGGEQFTDSCLIDEDVIQAIRNHTFMAPLHNPANLSGIDSARRAYPDLPHVAVFDTAFFQTMPEKAYLYALPHSLYKEHGIRRYGFHGTSHKFVSQQAAKMLQKPYEETNLITAHLGNGCSITALRQGKAVDTSMGLTPLEGLVMGTRCGDMDPSLTEFIAERLELTPLEVTGMLNKKSGLLGISGLSNDYRTLDLEAQNGHKGAQLALEIFSYRLAKYIGSYMVVTGPLDGLVFTGGIGENSASMRNRTMAYLSHLGFSVDEEANQAMSLGRCGLISDQQSTPILVIATNEEWVIADDTVACSAKA